MKTEIAPLPEPEILDIPSLASSFAKGGTDLLVVLGPTASGKTRYAVSLARRFFDEYGIRCEIISADSRQVYIGMDIGTGKDLEEYGEIPYHLIDILPAGSSYNVHSFQQDFSRVWKDALSRGVLPILCGGTGLYINAVTRAYDFKSKLPLSCGREEKISSDLPSHTYYIGTLVSREERCHRIDRRLDERLSCGMVEEVKTLLRSGIDPSVLIAYGLEYKYVTLYLTGQLDYASMREGLSVAIHRFAKRQMTWFRGMERSGVKIHWVEVPSH